MLVSKRRRGFTLLELIVVIAILAIIAGGLLVAYNGLEDKAAKSQASQTMAALNSSLRSFATVEGNHPTDFDSLLAGAFGTTGGGDGLSFNTPADAVTGTAGRAVNATIGGNAPNGSILTLGTKVAGKLETVLLDADAADAMIAAGITTLRYVDSSAGNDTSGGALSVTALDGSAASVGNILDIDIPNRIFDVPRDGSGRNRGRGFSALVGTGTAVCLWRPGAGGINNAKVNAQAHDVLIALGIGNNCSIVGTRAGVRTANLAEAPSYGAVARKFNYSRYLALYKVGELDDPATSGVTPVFGTNATAVGEATFVGILDTRGDFLDEEIAEASGQKE